MVGTRMYVGGLSSMVRERDIDRFFKGFSGVGDIVMKNGFAFVEFEDHREAEDAIYELNGKELLGGRVTVEKAKGTPRNSRWPNGGGGGGGGGMRSGGGGGWGGGGGGGRNQYQQRRMPQQGGRYGQPSRTKYRLTVTNLSSRVSWQDLKDYMRQAGEVTYADAHKNRKNEGVIEFASHADMRNALSKLDGKELQGRRIRLYEEDSQGGMGRRRSRSRSPVSRSKSRSASRSRSRSRSRSTSRPRYQSRDQRSKSASRSRSRSPPPRRSMSRSRSRSRSMQKRSLSPRNERDSSDRD